LGGATVTARLWGALQQVFGETERNLREALTLADTMSPCVLWLDEIEKGMAQDSGESGTSKRVLGTLLT
jgi:SpoVK/Ycf46/Vps4 family AAA+-type ATPase